MVYCWIKRYCRQRCFLHTFVHFSWHTANSALCKHHILKGKFCCCMIAWALSLNCYVLRWFIVAFGGNQTMSSHPKSASSQTLSPCRKYASLIAATYQIGIGASASVRFGAQPVWAESNARGVTYMVHGFDVITRLWCMLLCGVWSSVSVKDWVWDCVWEWVWDLWGLTS